MLEEKRKQIPEGRWRISAPWKLTKWHRKQALPKRFRKREKSACNSWEFRGKIWKDDVMMAKNVLGDWLWPGTWREDHRWPSEPTLGPRVWHENCVARLRPMDNINRKESKSWFWDVLRSLCRANCQDVNHEQLWRQVLSCWKRIDGSTHRYVSKSLSPFQVTTGLHKDNQPMTLTSWSWTMASGSYGVRPIWSPWQVTCLSHRRFKLWSGWVKAKMAEQVFVFEQKDEILRNQL